MRQFQGPVIFAISVTHAKYRIHGSQDDFPRFREVGCDYKPQRDDFISILALVSESTHP